MALKSSELPKVGFSVTESPLASSTGVPLAKEALAWQPLQQSQSLQQPQSPSQSSQQPLLQPHPQPVLRRLEQLLQPQLLHVLQPQPLQPQLSPHGSQQQSQELTGPQGPVKKGKLRLVQVPQRLNGPEMLRSTPKQLQPARTVAQALQPQLLQELQLLHPVLRRVEQVLQPQL